VTVGTGRPGARPEPKLLAGFDRLPRWLAAALAIAALLGFTAIVLLALSYYPRGEPPSEADVERRAAAVFGAPEGGDATVIGDLLVERFYALDADSGERYVADMLKGRIQGLQSAGPVGTERYIALLDLANLQRDRALYAAFVEAVARPQGNYLGLRVFPGFSDAFRLNYDGSLPERRQAISGPDGEDAFDYLLAQRYAQVGEGPRLIRVQGHNYVLNNTERFAFFRSEFRTGRALLLSELIIVDATSTRQRATFFRLQDQYRSTEPVQP
jgi:hypothetical protein